MTAFWSVMAVANVALFAIAVRLLIRGRRGSKWMSS